MPSSLSCCHLNKEPGPSSQSPLQRSVGPETAEGARPRPPTHSQQSPLSLYTAPVAKPSLQASNATVTEHEGPVILTCLADETGVSIRWFFKGQSLLLAERMTLSSDNSTLTIDPVSREDAGDYQCEASNRGSSSRSDPLRLRVTCEWPSSPPVLVVQWCPTPCGTTHLSSLGYSVQGISQARALEWVPFATPGDHPDPRMEPESTALQALFPYRPPGKPILTWTTFLY